MANVNVKVTGIDETNKNLIKQYEKIAQDVKAPVLKYAKDVVRRYKEVTPVGPTGNLKKSIGQKMIRKTRGGFFLSGTARSVIARATKSKKGYHRHLVAYGTGPRFTKTNSRKGLHRLFRRKKDKQGTSRGSMPANREFANVAEKVDKLPFDAEIMKLIERDEYL